MNLILGGTHGLGQEIAKNLQVRGEKTFVAGRSYDQAQHGTGMVLDLENEDEVNLLVTSIQEVGGLAVERFFWVAGRGYKGNFAAQPDPRQMARMNFSDVMPIAQAVWAKMLAEDEPTNFVVVSSSSGLKARPDEATYAGTKHAQVGYATSMGLESARLQSLVRVTLVTPGGMRTDFYGDAPPPDFETYLDPTKVAAHICSKVLAQEIYFEAVDIPRGSL